MKKRNNVLVHDRLDSYPSCWVTWRRDYQIDLVDFLGRPTGVAIGFFSKQIEESVQYNSATKCKLGIVCSATLASVQEDIERFVAARQLSSPTTAVSLWE